MLDFRDCRLREEGEAFRGDGERRKPVEDDGSVEGFRRKLTSPIDMVMLSGRVAASAAMVVIL
jgi:hypothetical protein